MKRTHLIIFASIILMPTFAFSQESSERNSLAIIIDGQQKPVLFLAGKLKDTISEETGSKVDIYSNTYLGKTGQEIKDCLSQSDCRKQFNGHLKFQSKDTRLLFGKLDINKTTVKKGKEKTQIELADMFLILYNAVTQKEEKEFKCANCTLNELENQVMLFSFEVSNFVMKNPSSWLVQEQQKEVKTPPPPLPLEPERTKPPQDIQLPPERPDSHFRTYGFITLAAGGITEVLGIFFGYQANSVFDDYQRTAIQIKADEHRKTVENYALAANISFGVGTAMILAGGTMIVLDVFEIYPVEFELRPLSQEFNLSLAF